MVIHVKGARFHRHLPLCLCMCVCVVFSLSSSSSFQTIIFFFLLPKTCCTILFPSCMHNKVFHGSRLVKVMNITLIQQSCFDYAAVPWVLGAGLLFVLFVSVQTCVLLVPSLPIPTPSQPDLGNSGIHMHTYYTCREIFSFDL